MTDTSIRIESPPEQDDELIASWGARHGTWIRDLGDGEAEVSMWVDGKRETVADVDYGETGATSPVRWKHNGPLVMAQYKRDAWDTQIYKGIARWLKTKAES